MPLNKLPLYIGIAGALGMAACDMILLAQAVSGTQYDLSSFGAMHNVDSVRAFIGSTFGLVCAFFICFGFWYMKGLFEKVNARLAMLLFIALCSVEFFGGAFHAGYYFLSYPWLSVNNAPYISPLVWEEFKNHLEVISYLGVPGFVVGTILYVKLAWGKGFPKWLKFANPLVLCGLFLAAFSVLPAPVGGYLKPTFVNLGLATWFICLLKLRRTQV